MDRLAIVEEHVRFENAHDLDGIMGTFGAVARYDDEPWNEHHLGHDQVRSHYQALLQVTPDLKTDVQKRHVTGEAVILEVVVSGNQRGTWRGLPPTGRFVEFPLCGVVTFGADGKIAGERIFRDNSLDFGTGYDCFDALSNLENPTIPLDAKVRRVALRALMEKRGFKPLDSEWWHFTLVDEPYPSTYFDFEIQ